MAQPQVIFLDAVGTLFGVRGSVGEIYSNIARQGGVEVHPETVDQNFRQVFQNSSPCAFPQASLAEIPNYEFDWWQKIAYATFAKAGVIHQFTDFGAFFRDLYAYFATPYPWQVYPDVIPALMHWQEQGIELGIISNFDTRLYSVLDALGLQQFFDSVTISSVVGAAKPEKQIFTSALEKHQCLPSQAWHIGDSKAEDYQGALAVGIHAFLIER